LIKRYEASNRAALKSDKTSGWYTENLLLFVRYLDALKLPADLSRFNVDCIRDYILHLRERVKFTGCKNDGNGSTRLKPKTIQCHVRTLKAFSTWLHTEGYISENRLQNLKLPKAPSVLIQPLTPEEIRRSLKRIGTHTSMARRNLTVFMLALDTGLRESEIASIELGNLNLEAGQIKVMGKGAKERVVPVGNRVRLELYAYIQKERAKFDYAKSNRLFLGPGGVPLTANGIKLMFSRLAPTHSVSPTCSTAGTFSP
jgi:integrase/recombinase XerD